MEPSEARPRATPSGLIFRLDSMTRRLDFPELFSGNAPVEVELGSGDGTFLADYAARHPERHFLGVERLLGRLRKLDRKGMRRGLLNLRLVRVEGHYLAKYLLPPASASAFHIYFPDPWPKRKHRKNRLINEEFSRTIAAALVPKGVVYLRTDDRDYFAQMTAVFGSHPSFAGTETPAEVSDVLTDFERGFVAQGVSTCRAAYRLEKNPAAD